MLVVEIGVAPFLEARVVTFVVLVAGFLDRLVEVYCVFVEEVAGSQITASTKPPCI